MPSRTRKDNVLQLSTAERLVKAARESLLLEGAAHASLKTIAGRAGLNHGLIHRYFGSKEALMVAVLDDIDHALPALGTASPAEDAKLIIQALFKDQRVSIELLSLSYQMPQLRRSMRQRTRKVIRQTLEQLPYLTDLDAIQLHAQMMGLVVYQSLDPQMPIEEAVEKLCERYIRYPAASDQRL